MSKPKGPLITFRYFLEHLGVSALSLSVRYLSADRIFRLGQALGSFVYLVAGSRVRTARTNLDIAFGQTKSPEEKQRIVRDSFRHFCVTALQCLWLEHDKRRRIEQLVKSEPKGLELLRECLKKGKGVIVLTAHYGNWEVPGIYNGYLGICPAHFIVRRLDNPYLEARVRRFRSVAGNGLIYRGESPIKIVRALKSNACVVVMMDQNTAKGGIFVDFFGKKAATPRAVAALSLKLGAPILPILSHPTERGAYSLELGPVLQAETTGDKQQDILNWTQACESFLESVIRNRPEPWMWFHRRFKTRPPEDRGEKIYS